MSVIRVKQTFPTRNYPYRAIPPEDTAVDTSRAAAPLAITPNTLYRHVSGVDTSPKPMTPEELAGLNDPLGHLLRSGKPFPLTLRELLAAIDALEDTPQALPKQLVFLVADGGHIPMTPETLELQRAFRFAIARGAGDFPLLISTSTALDFAGNGAFLQIIGWDATDEVFHYYERRDGTYFWAGKSPFALEAPSRGKGPFDSHVNGSLVMKELRSPWIHWHAPQAGIHQEAFEAGDPLLAEPLFQQKVTADRLEQEVVRPGIERWNLARVRKVTAGLATGNPWNDIDHFLRQVVTDTTVNLATSETISRTLMDDSTLQLPITFFLNTDTLLGTLQLELDDSVTGIVIPGRLYRTLLTTYDIHRTDGFIRVEGDSPFAWLTPEPAFEDTNLIALILEAGLLSPRFIAAITMVDFPNPVFSSRRAKLLRYTPSSAPGPNASDALEDAFVSAVREAVANNTENAGQPNSPEREFLANWDEADWEQSSSQRLTEYLAQVQKHQNDADAVDGWFRLAEYRCRQFRKRPLAEFDLTTPRTNIPEGALPLAMMPDGLVIELQ